MPRGCGKKGAKALVEKKAKKRKKNNAGHGGGLWNANSRFILPEIEKKINAVQKRGLRKASRDDLLAIAKQAGYEYGAETSPDDLSKIYIEVFKRLEHGLLYDFSTKPH